MNKTKVVSLVLVMLLCYADGITAKEPKKEEKEMTIVELEHFMEAIQNNNVSFVVAYNENAAEPVVIAPGPNNPMPTEIPGPVNIKSLEKLLGKRLSDERFIELKSTTIFSVYGSPGVNWYPRPGGRYILVSMATTIAKQNANPDNDDLKWPQAVTQVLVKNEW